MVTRSIWIFGLIAMGVWVVFLSVKRNYKAALWIGGPQLRGVNIWQKRLNLSVDGDSFGVKKIGPPFEDREWAGLRALGANYVHLSVPGPFSERPPYQWDEEVAQELDTLIASALRYDLFVGISVRTGPGRNEAGFDATETRSSLHAVWTDGDAQDAWVQMWKKMAERFAHHPHVVAYGLLVEPNADAVRVPSDWNLFASRLAQAIRSQDADTPILLSPLGFADPNMLSQLKIESVPGVVLEIHHYGPYAYTHQEDGPLSYPGPMDTGAGVTEKVDRAWIEKRVRAAVQAAREKKLPLWIGEFGVMRWVPGAPQYLADSLEVFEKEGLNSAVWLWESAWPKITYDQFNFRRGTRREHHQDEPNNPLVTTLLKAWSRNKAFPSTRQGADGRPILR